MSANWMPGLRLKAGFALSLSLIVTALGAFSASRAHAQASISAAPSAQRGLAIYMAKCSGCHSIDEHRVGPAHAGVFGRRAGQAKDYEYSQALANSQVVWKNDTLLAWLADPEKMIAGQRMGYRLSLAHERADVVAYLATLTSTK